jgi:hypothetical protein
MHATSRGGCQHRATFWQIGDGAICFRFPSEIEAGKKKCSELVMLWAGSLALSSPLSVQALLMRI